MTLFTDSIQQLNRLRKIRDPHNFNIVFMGDSWVGSGEVSDDIFEQAVKTAVRYEPLAMIHGGDIVYSGTIKANFNPFTNFIRELNKWNKDKSGNRIPMFVTPGNHEMDLNKEAGPARIKNFRDYIGPLHFMLDLPEYHLTMIGLNTLYEYVYKQYGLTKRELEFLRDSLNNRHRNTFVAMHVPPEEPELGWRNGDAFPNQRGRAEFYKLVENKVSKVLVSHIHAFQLARVHNTDFILSGGAGATLNRGAEYHIVVINIKNGVISTRKVNIGWTRQS